MLLSPILAHYKTLFVGRFDDYAMQLSTGRYKRVGKPLTDTALQEHLSGEWTYGTYVMDASGYCRFAVIDADSIDGLERLLLIQERLAEQAIASYVERSRRGGHLWIFFAVPALASWVRTWLLPFCPMDFEFYPKQDEGTGYGSLIRLPMGVHRKSGMRYQFVEQDTAGQLIPLTTTARDQERWFASIKRVSVPRLEHTLTEIRTGKHPPKWTPPPATSGGRSPIRAWNAEQDPYQVIGRYVSLSSKGVGQCPFGEHHSNGADTNASFKVYPPEEEGGYCWYCYTWRKGGSVFDFLRHYYGLEARELWERIQDGSVI